MRSGYRLDYPPSKWEEGVLLGNGKTGAIMMAGALRETFVLTNEKLYAPVNSSVTPPPMAECLPRIRELLADGKYAEAADLPVRLMRELYHNDGLIWTNPFFPACDMFVEIVNEGEISEYSRSLDFSTGLGIVEFTMDGIKFKREAFISRKDGVGVLRLTSGKPSSYKVGFKKHPFESNSQSRLEAETYHLGEPSITSNSEEINYRCDYTTGNGYYIARAKVANTDGFTKDGNGMIIIENAAAALILFSLEATGINRFEACLELPFEELLDRHVEIHGGLFSRVSLRIGSENVQEDDMKLWEESKKSDKPSPGFLNKVFDAGRYEILSSCGETPPNLQGIWTGTFNVPWSSDYTNNGNVQTAILGLLPSGMFECMLSLFDYLESHIEDFRYNAKRIYNCRGVHIPSRTSDRGVDFHFNDNWCMLFWTAGAAWMSRFYYDYWLFTRDDEFFRSRALPFMKEAALFYEDFLIEGENGKWLFSPSYSPENNPANSGSQACINAAMDLAIATELFSNLISGCATLGIESGNIPKWREFISKMPPYLINADGALKEWATPLLEDRYDHRHSSHLYMLYYDIPRWVKEDKTLFDACVKAYELRMEGRKKEKGVMAFGLVQCGMAAAHLGDSKRVDLLLGSMAANNYYPDFASSHDAGPKIFNADISGGFPALMMEALAQSAPRHGKDGSIEGYDISILPALPDCMSSGCVKNMRLRGGFALDMEWKDKQPMSYDLRNDAAPDTKYALALPRF